MNSQSTLYQQIIDGKTICYQLETDRIIAVDEKGNCIGEIDFPLAQGKQSVVNMNHTFVDPNYRGQKIADHLFDLAIAEIQKRQLKIIPTCSYVVVKFNRLPELHHLLEE